MQLLYAFEGFVLFGLFVCFNSGKREPNEHVFLLALNQFVLHAQQWISNLLGVSPERHNPLQVRSSLHRHRASHLVDMGMAWQSVLRQTAVFLVSDISILRHLLLFFLHDSEKHRQIYSLLLTQGFFRKQHFSPVISVFCNLWWKATKKMTKLSSCVSFFGLKYSITYTKTEFCGVVIKVSSARIWQDISAGMLTNQESDSLYQLFWDALNRTCI